MQFGECYCSVLFCSTVDLELVYSPQTSHAADIRFPHSFLVVVTLVFFIGNFWQCLWNFFRNLSSNILWTTTFFNHFRQLEWQVKLVWLAQTLHLFDCLRTIFRSFTVLLLLVQHCLKLYGKYLDTTLIVQASCFNFTLPIANCGQIIWCNIFHNCMHTDVHYFMLMFLPIWRFLLPPLVAMPNQWQFT